MKIVLNKHEIGEYIIKGLIADGKFDHEAKTAKKYHLTWTINEELEDITVTVEQEDNE